MELDKVESTGQERRDEKKKVEERRTDEESSEELTKELALGTWN